MIQKQIHHSAVIVLIILTACNFKGTSDSSETGTPNRLSLANELEESLKRYILEPWYPLVVDTLYGGYISRFQNDWSPGEGSRDKALVQQARHLWATSYIFNHYPERKEYLDYASQGFRFIVDHFWDETYGGFYYAVREDGTFDGSSNIDKQVYGQAFAIYGLAQYYEVSKEPAALEMAKRGFQWIEKHAHDPGYGGYYDLLDGEGTPKILDSLEKPSPSDLPSVGLKEYNSSIHIMEALSELYHVWPDNLLRARLQEMFYLVRDTFVHPDGYEQLYFYPDWTLVPEEVMEERSPDNYWYTQHLSFCHDVEVAYLLLETAHMLGMGDDMKTHDIAKKMVDHSLKFGWDEEAGGFYYAGKRIGGKVVIIDPGKPWWGEIEGLNALILMHTLYPDDPMDYYRKSVQLWEYIDSNLIDKEHGGWYNFGKDQSPETLTEMKSHWWKTTYHNVRGMVNSINMLRAH